MVKHQSLAHPGEQPAFIFKVVSSHRTALNRQVRDAVRIRRRGGAGNILNSEAEFNRCHIPRLVVEEEDQDTKVKRLLMEKELREEMRKILEDNDLSWEEQKTRAQELTARKRSRDEVGGEQETQEEGAPRKKMRKLQFEVLDNDWGAKDSGGEEEDSTARIPVASITVPSNPPTTNHHP